MEDNLSMLLLSLLLMFLLLFVSIRVAQYQQLGMDVMGGEIIAEKCVTLGNRRRDCNQLLSMPLMILDITQRDVNSDQLMQLLHITGLTAIQ